MTGLPASFDEDLAREPEPVCYVCTGPPDECGCDGDDEMCPSCNGTGWCIPSHCCACGGGEYDCTCCPSCGGQNVATCPCTLTVSTVDGGTIELPGTDEGAVQ